MTSQLEGRHRSKEVWGNENTDVLCTHMGKPQMRRESQCTGERGRHHI